jgi:hypothetical protein
MVRTERKDIIFKKLLLLLRGQSVENVEMENNIAPGVKS